MESVIHTDGLTKKYADLVALDHLDLDVKKGEILGYLGPNGAGKTTTIGLLLGLIRPAAGQAHIFGLDAQKDKVALHKRLAYGVIAWSFLTEILSSGLNANHWLLDTSLPHHMILAPANNPDWGTNLIIVCLSTVLVVLGAAWFSYRDLQNE